MRVSQKVIEARYRRLIGMVDASGYVALADLCRDLGISEVTARRDLARLEEAGRLIRVPGGAVPAESGAKAVAGKAVSEAIATLFESEGAQALKAAICEMGRRCWARGFTEGNGGNFSARLGDHFLCTPTGVGKGFMTPDMICLVDSGGRQIAGHGAWQCTSEIFAHLAIYRVVPTAASVAHAHPVHATAFAISGIEPPRGLLPEVEIFVGPIVRADYRMPGSSELGAIIEKLAPGHQSILLRNHGLICWGATVEDAYFKLEITESYCRTLAVAAQLPGRQTTIPPDELAKLLELKKRLGIPDARLGD